MDPRIKKLADILVNYSCKIKKGENILIDCFGNTPFPLLKAIIREIYKAGGRPFVNLKDNSIIREIIRDCTSEQLKTMSRIDLLEMKAMNAYMGIRAHDNVNELSDIPGSKLSQYSKEYAEKVTNYRVDKTRWVVLRYPNNSMAQLYGASLEEFEDFYFKVCNLDYSKMSAAMDNLVQVLNETDMVRIIGPGTDLEFSIKDIPAIKCAGEYNIPDGEVFTAPVRNSVNGIISFNIPQLFQGFTYENVKLEFKKGRIIEASANDTAKINKIFDTDKGARYTGEFALGVNPYIIKPMKDGLFDEKIMGSFHFTPGRCYEEANNGNKSAIHWDLINIQTRSFGGGEIYFDDTLVRKDGIFLTGKLKVLNPENLK